MIKTQKPVLDVIFINEFGDKTEIIKDLDQREHATEEF